MPACFAAAIGEPTELPISVSSMFEACGVVAIVGIWDHNAQNC